MSTDTAANTREIEGLRKRVHDHANLLQASIGRQEAVGTSLDNLDRKLDAIHSSVKEKIAELKADVKEDLAEIKAETSETNGRVTGHDRDISQLKGGVLVIAAGLTPIVALLVFVLQSLVFAP